MQAGREFTSIAGVAVLGLVQLIVTGLLAFDPAGGLGPGLQAFLVLALLTCVPVAVCFVAWFRSGQRALPIATQVLAFCSLALCVFALAIPGHTLGLALLLAFVAQYIGGAVAWRQARRRAT